MMDEAYQGYRQLVAELRAQVKELEAENKRLRDLIDGPEKQSPWPESNGGDLSPRVDRGSEDENERLRQALAADPRAGARWPEGNAS